MGGGSPSVNGQKAGSMTREVAFDLDNPFGMD